MLKFTKYIILILIILITETSFAKDLKNKRWHIKSDEIISQDINAGEYILDGNIVISDGEITVTADFVKFNTITQKIFARGNISLETKGKDKLKGTSIDFDLKKKTGVIYNGTLFIKNKHFYIRGKKIQKVSENSYEIDDVSVTSCDDETPDWKITARNLSVTIEGYGYLTHSMFWVKNVPLLYFPGAVFPAKLKRQSGLLYPYFETSSANGFTYNQPFFLALGRSYDLTYYNNYMDKKGFMPGLQGRYVFSKSSKGTLFYNYLEDQNIDTSYTNVVEERYWFRAKQRQTLPFGITLNADIDFASDQYYLTDFKEDKLTGYDDTNSYFEKNFGSSLDNYNDSERQNSLSLKKSWSKYSLDMKFSWLDNVAVKNTDSSNNSLHQLPYMNVTGLKQTLFDTPLYYTFQTRYDNFYRIDTDIAYQKGHRGDTLYKLSYPKSYGFLNIEPLVGIRYTSWDTTYEDRDYENTGRTIYYSSLTASSEIYKVYKNNVSSVKHSIIPSFILSYIDDYDENSYPVFDSIDSISDQQKITYSLTNTFISKSKNGNNSFLYNQFLWFKFSQTFDYIVYNDEGDEPFSAISLELKITPKNYFSLSYDGTYSTYSDVFNTSNTSGTVKYGNIFSINLEHRFTRADSDNSIRRSELLLAGIQFNLNDSISFFYNYEKDLYLDQENKIEIGGIYRSQCWEFTTKYLEEDDDKKYMFFIQLNGIGTIDADKSIDN